MALALASRCSSRRKRGRSTLSPTFAGFRGGGACCADPVAARQSASRCHCRSVYHEQRSPAKRPGRLPIAAAGRPPTSCRATAPATDSASRVETCHRQTRNRFEYRTTAILAHFADQPASSLLNGCVNGYEIVQRATYRRFARIRRASCRCRGESCGAYQRRVYGCHAQAQPCLSPRVSVRGGYREREQQRIPDAGENAAYPRR